MHRKQGFTLHLLIGIAAQMAFLGTPLLLAQAEDRAPSKTPALIWKNTFATAEAVLKHFLDRDEAGFYWAGMTDPEREALTQWKQAPQAETFFRSSARKIGPAKTISETEIQIPVSWRVEAHQDGFGSQLPLPETGKVMQNFHLEKDHGVWKISTPRAEDYTPILKTRSSK